MEFGVFDHVDANGTPLHQYYEIASNWCAYWMNTDFAVTTSRSTIRRRWGWRCPRRSHVGRRTSTPRLRFGPLVFALPLYHPPAQEIGMVDQISKGRLDIGPAGFA